MNSKGESKRDDLPEQFDSYEQAAEFWDAHDTADYLDVLTTVETEAHLRFRHFEVEIDADVAQLLRDKAKQSGQSLSRLVSDLLRKQLS